MIDKINHCVNHNRFISIDTEELTALELIGKIIDKNNEIINNLNELDTTTKTTLILFNQKLEYLLNEGMKEEVKVKLTEWLNDGVFNGLINQTLLKEINDKVDLYTTKINKLGMTAMENGCAGNGITDDGVNLQRLIDLVASTGGGKILLNQGHYIIGDSIRTLTIPSNITIEGNGATLDFSKKSTYSADLSCHLMEGIGRLSEPQIPTTDITLDSMVINVGGFTDLKPYDMIGIMSETKWEETGSTLYVNLGELSIISKYENERLVMSNTPFSEYKLEDGVKIFKVYPVENVTIKGVKFIGRGRRETNTDSDYGLTFTYGKNINIEDCEFTDIDTKQLEFRSCMNFKVSNCKFHHKGYMTGLINQRVQYQIRCADACQDGIISDCQGYNGRHMFNTGHSVNRMDGSSTTARGYLFGVVRNVQVINCVSNGTWHAGFSTHNDGENVSFYNCVAKGSLSAGFNPRCSHNTISNCKSINCHQGILLSDNIRDVVITGNEIINCRNQGIIFSSPNDLDFKSLVITNNVIKDVPTGSAVTLSTNTTITQTGKVIITGNTFINCGTGNVAVIRIIAPKISAIIENNVFDISRTHAIRFDSVDKVELSNNTISRCDRALNVISCNELIARDNLVLDYGTSGLMNYDVKKALSHFALNNVYKHPVQGWIIEEY